MDIWERTADIRDVSDVIVVNRDGEVSCFYVDENTPQKDFRFYTDQLIRGACDAGYERLQN